MQSMGNLDVRLIALIVLLFVVNAGRHPFR